MKNEKQINEKVENPELKPGFLVNYINSINSVKPINLRLTDAP